MIKQKLQHFKLIWQQGKLILNETVYRLKEIRDPCKETVKCVEEFLDSNLIGTDR